MNKTPEEYFQEQAFAPEVLEKEAEFTSAEKAFIEKYLGLAEEDILEKLGIEAPVEARTVVLPTPQLLVDAPSTEILARTAVLEPEPETVAPEAALPEQDWPEEELESQSEEDIWASAEVEEGIIAEKFVVAEVSPAIEEEKAPEALAQPEIAVTRAPDLEAQLRLEPELQLISFFLGEQEYTLPIKAVQEVIRYVAPTKLPGSGSTFAGVINLRGKVTPLFKLSDLVGMKRKSSQSEVGNDEDKFIIVCRHKGLQLGLIVRNVATIYRASQKQIEWNIDSRLGGDIDLVVALMKSGEYLVGIFSIDRIIEKVLRT